jgi:hypothetical protein
VKVLVFDNNGNRAIMVVACGVLGVISGEDEKN